MTANPHVLSTILLVAHWTVVTLIVLRVIMAKRAVGVSVAWLAVAFSVPFVGAAFYFLFGESRLGRRFHGNVRRVAGPYAQWRRGLTPAPEAARALEGAPAAALAHSVHAVRGYPLQQAHDVVLLADTTAIFTALIDDIEQARHSCHLEFYIWNHGGWVERLAAALVAARRRGVECRVLVDGLGSKAFLGSEDPARLRAQGIEIAVSLPVAPVDRRADLRNHRKIVVIDGHVAYTGSQNLVDPHVFKQDAGVGEWVDAMVRLKGPLAETLGGVFQADWSVATETSFVAPTARPAEAPTGPPVLGQPLPSGPTRNPEAIHQALLEAMYAARRELVITTPYFVPDDSLKTALLSAALRGVEVTVVLPAKNDSLMVRYASASHFDELLAAGVRVARYDKGLLHTKSVTVDGAFSVFGSVNLDMRSLWLNFEISLLIWDRDFTARLRALQDGYIADSQVLDAAEWSRRPFRTRFLENTFRLLSPLL